eukprot:ANDGO_01958.mRNA.1 rRNA-processing protein fcf2
MSESELTASVSESELKSALRYARGVVHRLEKQATPEILPRTVILESSISNYTTGKLVSSTLKKAAEDPLSGIRRGHGAEQDVQKKKRCWHEMNSVELTPELKKDLLALQLRSYTDPKKVGQKRDELAKKLPDQFQIGTVVDDAYDPFRRLSKRARGQSFVDQYVQVDDVKEYAGKKFKEIMQDRANTRKKSVARTANVQKRKGGSHRK